jgi:hypothetical protein
MGADGGGELVPWLLSIGGGIVTTLCAVGGKLWAQLLTERRERAAEVEQLRHELAEANARVVKLQQEANERSDEHQREHRRDLRRLAGLSTSIDPPPLGAWPPVIIREAPARPGPPPKKSR